MDYKQEDESMKVSGMIVPRKRESDESETVEKPIESQEFQELLNKQQQKFKEPDAPREGNSSRPPDHDSDEDEPINVFAEQEFVLRAAPPLKIPKALIPPKKRFSDRPNAIFLKTPIKEKPPFNKKKQLLMAESPNMENAQVQFGDLLSCIHEGSYHGSEEEAFSDSCSDDVPRVDSPDTILRNSQLQRSLIFLRYISKIGRTFHFRGRNFILEDNEDKPAMSLFSLSRTWVKGQDDRCLKPTNSNFQREKSPPDHTLDILATRNITVLPGARQCSAVDIRPPNASSVPRLDKDANDSDPAKMLAQYKKHWANVNKKWNEYYVERRKPYERSLRLIDTEFSISQNNQQF